MSRIRKEARGRPCTIRYPGCDGGGETTVLAHYRLAGTCGAGMKPPDELGAYACHHCHDVADGRKQIGWSRDAVRLAHCEGVMRTWMYRKEHESN
jgi:hypothetical protein